MMTRIMPVLFLVDEEQGWPPKANITKERGKIFYKKMHLSDQKMYNAYLTLTQVDPFTVFTDRC